MTMKPKDTGKIFILDAYSEIACIIRCVEDGGCLAVVYSDLQSSCTGYNVYNSNVTLDGVLEHGWIYPGECLVSMVVAEFYNTCYVLRCKLNS
jgi:hypothetical protein